MKDTEAKAVVGYLEQLGFHNAKHDAVADAVLEKYKAEVAELQKRNIGEAGEDLCLERYPGQGRSSTCDVGTWIHGWKHGSVIAHHVVKAFLNSAKTSEIAMSSGGGVRADLNAGNFSYNDVLTLLPFANTLVVLDISGSSIKQVLEDALSNTLDDGGSSGSYPYAAGLRFELNCNQTKGSRVSKLEVNSRLAGSWTQVEMGRQYKVVTTSYLGAGKDGYVEFGKFPNTNTYIEYSQSFMDYVQAQNTPLMVPPVSDVSTQKYIDKNNCDHSIAPPGGCSEEVRE